MIVSLWSNYNIGSVPINTYYYTYLRNLRDIIYVAYIYQSKGKGGLIYKGTEMIIHFNGIRTSVPVLAVLGTKQDDEVSTLTAEDDLEFGSI